MRAFGWRRVLRDRASHKDSVSEQRDDEDRQSKE
jgi:hypothetical protein